MLKCFNCRWRLDNVKIHNVCSLSEPMQKLLATWKIVEKLPLDGVICHECYECLQQLTQTTYVLNPMRVYGHTDICINCGVPWKWTKLDVLAETDPVVLVILSWNVWNEVIDHTPLVCRDCSNIAQQHIARNSPKDTPKPSENNEKRIDTLAEPPRPIASQLDKGVHPKDSALTEVLEGTEDLKEDIIPIPVLRPVVNGTPSNEDTTQTSPNMTEDYEITNSLNNNVPFGTNFEESALCNAKLNSKVAQRNDCIRKVEFECDYCAKKCTSKGGLMKHIRAHTTGTKYTCSDCHKTFKTKFYLIRHINTHGEHFKHCTLCNATLNSKVAYCNHCDRDIKFECDYCAKKYTYKRGLMIHIKTHTTKQKDAYKCADCVKSFATKYSLMRHITRHKEPYICNVCAKIFRYKRAFDKHKTKTCKAKTTEARSVKHINPVSRKLTPVVDKSYTTKHDTSYNAKLLSKVAHSNNCDWNIIFECNHCSKKHKSKSGLIKHIKAHTTEKNYNCTYCAKSFRAKYALKRHAKTHGENFKQCTLCNAKLNSKVAHCNKCNRNIQFECNYCANKYTYKRGLIKHIKTHTIGQKKNYACTGCAKSFATKYSLRRHMETHNAKGNITCKVCAKTFRRKSAFDKHIKTCNVGREKRAYRKRTPILKNKHICDVCGRRCPTKNNLEMHALTHSYQNPHSYDTLRKIIKREPRKKTITKQTFAKPKLYDCPECAKKYTTKYLLTRHMTAHTNKILCVICDKTFKKSNYLKHHIFLHLGRRTFVCDICHKQFALKSYLRKHMYTHSIMQSPNTCKICAKNYIDKKALVNHMYVIHQIIM